MRILGSVLEYLAVCAIGAAGAYTVATAVSNIVSDSLNNSAALIERTTR